MTYSCLSTHVAQPKQSPQQQKLDSNQINRHAGCKSRACRLRIARCDSCLQANTLIAHHDAQEARSWARELKPVRRFGSVPCVRRVCAECIHLLGRLSGLAFFSSLSSFRARWLGPAKEAIRLAPPSDVRGARCSSEGTCQTWA